MLESIRSIVVAVCMLAATVSVAADSFVLVVMDPLSKPLSCDCVRGYAQREYKLLAEHLESSLGRSVKVVWFESLAEALGETGGEADLIIGKYSVVLADEKATSYAVKPIAQLTGKEGDVTQKGLIVVAAMIRPKNFRHSVATACYLAPPTPRRNRQRLVERAFKSAGVAISTKRDRYGACSEAASAILRRRPTSWPQR